MTRAASGLFPAVRSRYLPLPGICSVAEPQRPRARDGRLTASGAVGFGQY